jgi:hypothetical protein
MLEKYASLSYIMAKFNNTHLQNVAGNYLPLSSFFTVNSQDIITTNAFNNIQLAIITLLESTHALVQPTRLASQKLHNTWTSVGPILEDLVAAFATIKSKLFMTIFLPKHGLNLSWMLIAPTSHITHTSIDTILVMCKLILLFSHQPRLYLWLYLQLTFLVQLVAFQLPPYGHLQPMSSNDMKTIKTSALVFNPQYCKPSFIHTITLPKMKYY